MVKKNPTDFEAQMARLQAIVQELERADLPLEQNVALFKEGRALALSCKELLVKAKNEIALVTEEGLEPFTGRFADDLDGLTGLNDEGDAS